MKYYAVIDTNVIVSALLKWNSLQIRLLSLCDRCWIFCACSYFATEIALNFHAKKNGHRYERSGIFLMRGRHAMVEAVALEQMVLEDLVCPLAESCSLYINRRWFHRFRKNLPNDGSQTPRKRVPNDGFTGSVKIRLILLDVSNHIYFF